MKIECVKTFRVYNSEKFDQYVCRHGVVVETDHKSLVNISTKPIHNAPKRYTNVIVSTKVQLGYSLQKREGNVHGGHSIKGIAIPQRYSATFNTAIRALPCYWRIDPYWTTGNIKRKITANVWNNSTRSKPNSANAGSSTCWPCKSCVPVEAKPYLKCNDELSV